VAFDDLEDFQLVMGHVITHPELEHVFREGLALAAHEGDDGDGVDVLAILKRRGFVLPPDSTARVRPPVTDDPTDPGYILVCVSYHGHDFCAEWTPPITITVS
jgi:hypothetical protein